MYWSHVSYPHDRAAPVTKYAVQYSTDSAFASDGPHELLVYSNSSQSYRAPDLAGRYDVPPTACTSYPTLSSVIRSPHLTR